MKSQTRTRTPLQYIHYTSRRYMPFFVLIGVLLFLSCLVESLVFLFLRYGIDTGTDGATRHIWGAVLGILLLYLLHILFLRGGKLILCVILAKIQAFTKRLVANILMNAKSDNQESHPDQFDLEQFDPEQAAGDVSEGSSAFLHVWLAQLLPALLSLGLYTILISVYFPLFMGIGIVWFIGHFGLNVLLSKYERKLLNQKRLHQKLDASAAATKFREYTRIGYLILHAPLLLATLAACLVLWQDGIGYNGGLSLGSLFMITLLTLSFSRKLLHISSALPKTTTNYARLQAGLSCVLLAARQQQISEEASR